MNSTQGDESAKLCRIRLEIQGDDAAGYHLVVAPEGFFVADTWHETQEDAIAAAESAFGVGADAWSAEIR